MESKFEFHNRKLNNTENKEKFLKKVTLIEVARPIYAFSENRRDADKKEDKTFWFEYERIERFFF